MLTCFPGWTWEYIDDHMTLPRLAAITKFQDKNPPLHWLVAAHMGVHEHQAKAANKSGIDEHGNSLLDLFPVTRG